MKKEMSVVHLILPNRGSEFENTGSEGERVFFHEIADTGLQKVLMQVMA